MLKTNTYGANNFKCWGNGFEAIFFKWHITNSQGVGVHGTFDTKLEIILLDLLTTNMFEWWFYSTYVDFPHQTQQFWTILANSRFGISRVLGLQHYLWLHYFQW
jgi:hypothetical protein